MKILFLVPYPLQEAPSQRFRFEQYFVCLSDKGYHYEVSSFLPSRNWQIFFKSGRLLKKTAMVFSGFISRIFILFKISSFDYVFIHREATPVGPPVIEWIIAKILKKKIIYDFDDAIWLTDKIHEGKIEKLIRWRNKVSIICKWSHKVSCGNEYLCAYARRFNKNIVLNPTTIDTIHLHNPGHFIKPVVDKTVIGWTGSHSTLKYLDQLVPVLSDLEEKYPIQFLVIANQKPDLKVNSLRFIPWNSLSEAEDLMQIDIGVMPLPDDEWANGKCGFKILQYMALRIPALASPVGVNTKIITHEKNGFLCSDNAEWFQHLERLVTDTTLRKRVGDAGQIEVEKHYSVSSNTPNFLSLFE